MVGWLGFVGVCGQSAYLRQWHCRVGLFMAGRLGFLEFYVDIVLDWTGSAVLVSAVLVSVVSNRSLRVMPVVLRNLSVAFTAVGFDESRSCPMVGSALSKQENSACLWAEYLGHFRTMCSMSSLSGHRLQFPVACFLILKRRKFRESTSRRHLDIVTWSHRLVHLRVGLLGTDGVWRRKNLLAAEDDESHFVCHLFDEWILSSWIMSWFSLWRLRDGGCDNADFAALSAASFPLIPRWPGIQQIDICSCF